MKTVTIVGGSLAGWRSAQELREQGFDGRLVLVGNERHGPYDRPQLSKEFLTGQWDVDELALSSQTEDKELDVDWRLGKHAVRLDTRNGSVVLEDGESIRTDGVVIATGASRMTIPGAAEIPGSHLLYQLEDALGVRDEVGSGSRVVVVGGGLVGGEVAAACQALKARTTLVDTRHMPLVPTFGIEIAPLCFDLHEDHGVRTRCGTPARRVLGDERVTGVELADGRVLAADTVVVAVGVTPTTGWLRGSGVKLRDGVLTDAGMVTRLPNVVAVGDVARYHCVYRGQRVRFDNWTNAMNQPPTAVRNLLAGHTVEHYTNVPQLWSQQYGSTMQFAGFVRPKDKVAIVEGSPSAHRFVATYHRQNRLIGVFAMNMPKRFAAYRKRLPAALRAQTLPNVPAQTRGRSGAVARGPRR
ncbi:3-phenylpropionate/trans-cinnamate dioxygenase ferredoxin reductase subunit [Tamaricihabitans halophyticus]|uniref:3-phenylpropionate/trans-cinnamate dioxygenase ferredoxin reductase subunit n=1 Tax=Tamaricihabitans halophyticus TaxID=1262583 RepID=A0A4R2QSU9_9PSEU|nr:FAD-dependent oxidoreductase [Tamaricihabitans halophyticus]TCP52039.1 3-phenylpropionate/trans-cinnamate dioxygenase ferredoxin reductase subunit [Tamaricihabitans halophyticus]